MSAAVLLAGALICSVPAAPATAAPPPAPTAPGDPTCSTTPYSWVGGSVDLCRGVLVYSDYVHDDYGADMNQGNTTSRTSSLAPSAGDQKYPNPAHDASADLVRLTLRIEGNELVVEGLLNALFEPNQTTIGLAIDTDSNVLTGGGKWGPLNVVSTGWDVLHLFDQGNIATNTITGRVPSPGGTHWRVQAVTAITSNGQVMNVAFRGVNERARAAGIITDNTMGSWFEEKQAEALRLGIIDQFGHTVRPGDMVAGATSLQPPTGPGLFERVYRSDFTVGPKNEGVDVAGVPGRGDGGGLAKTGFEQGFQFLGHYQPYGIYIPPGDGPFGMQLVFHGSNANFSSLINQPGMQTRFGDELHRILVVPEARGKLGHSSDISERDQLDVIADMMKNYAIDPDKVFSSGYSQGGYIAYRFAMLYPDLFAGHVNWVGFTGDAKNGNDGPSYTSGGVGNVYDFVRNLRWVPSALMYAVADELVHINTAIAMEQQFAAFENVYTFYSHPAAEHLTFFFLDDWRKEAAYTKDLTRVRNPNRVTFRTATFLGSPAYGIRHDRAYWVSEIRGRSPIETAYQDVDLMTSACGGTVPVVAAHPPGAGPDPVPWTSKGEVTTGQAPIPAGAALRGTLANVASLRIDSTRACIAGTPFTYDITTDGPVVLTFSDGRALALPAAGRHQGSMAEPVGGFNAIGPERIFDTRGESPNALRQVPVAQVGGANVLEVEVTDLPGLVPASGVGAVSLNVAVDRSRGPGFVTVYPCGQRKLTASLNHAAGEIVSNAVITPVSPTGTVCFYSHAPTDIIVDINGWFAADGALTTLSPERVFDTRGESPNALRSVPDAQVTPSNVLEVRVVDLASVPATGVGAVSLNVAVTDPAAAGFVTTYPCGTRSLVASVNYAAGQTVSNAVLAPVSPTGTVCFYSSQPADIVVDLNGWFAPGAMLQSVGPGRVFDTRGESANAMRSVPVGRVGRTPLEVEVTDLGVGVPATGVSAVSLNVAVTEPEGPGFVTVYPCGTRRLVASVNYVAGETVSNAVIAPVSPTGTVCFYSYAATHLVVDVNGWFIDA